MNKQFLFKYTGNIACDFKWMNKTRFGHWFDEYISQDHLFDKVETDIQISNNMLIFRYTKLVLFRGCNEHK